jgi:hypothetical protein
LSQRRKKSKIDGQFTWRLVEMLESDPFRALSRAGHQILGRMEIELGHHGGTSNGKLKVPYGHFQAYGIDRESVAPAIREVVALGFVEITKRGRGGNAEYRELTEYRLTYKDTDYAKPTNEWRAIGEDAPAIASAARKAKDPDAVARSKRSAEKQIFGAEIPQVSGRKTRPENPTGPGRKTRRSSPGRKTRPTIYISGEDTEQPAREARPPNGAVASGAAATSAPGSLAGEPLALGDRADLLLSRVAGRLGSGQDGWLIVDAATEPEINNLIVLEARGKLDAATLAATRLKYRRGAA